jgi:hypothetical protein
MSFQVTDVNAAGATTVTYSDETSARSRYALLRATPATAYCQIVANGVIIKQFRRKHVEK